MIAQNVLKLYSQDKTGLVDYALESGGKERKIPSHAEPGFERSASSYHQTGS